jgi:hypothetical protein
LQSVTTETFYLQTRSVNVKADFNVSSPCCDRDEERKEV